jgi:transglutaminase-like putative cysteine protease
MLQVATARLVITRWTEYLFFAQTLAALGLILGLALGFSHFKRRAVIWLTVGYSIILIPWQLSLVIEDELLSSRLASLGGRLYFALVQFFQREPVQDGLLFVAFISTLVWFMSIASGYYWTRHKNYIAAILPGGIFTLVIHLYDQAFTSRVWLLAVYLLLALLLLGHQYYLRNRESWRERRVFLMQESTFDLTRGMVIAASLFVFVAWTVPASQAGLDAAERAWERVTEPWRDVQEWFSNAVESLQGATVRKPSDFYGNRLSLGSGSPLSENVLFSIQAPEFDEKQPRYYWRGYVYDLYQGYTWYSAAGASEEFSPSNEELFIPNADERVTGSFIFRTEIEQSLLYTATEPVWVSRPGRVQVITTETGEQDLLAWAAEPRLLPGEQYEVTAALLNPSIQQLQEAGTDYPQWVKDRYLQLPEDFSPRISELANQITQELETPYDKATAITRYLRREITYANPLPESPPPGVDPVEWILFDLKQGFCNYYAAAEVLMLRSVGVPARMAAGFAEGAFDEEANVYIVRSLNAHAWPEVYFPDIGWVEFEPTGNQDPLNRPNRPEDISAPEEQLGGPLNIPDIRSDDFIFGGREQQLEEGITPVTEQPVIINPMWYYLTAIIFLIGLLWILNARYTVIDRVPVYLQAAYERNGGHAPAWLSNWARWTMLTPIERSFETINRSLRLLGAPPALYATPAERAQSLLKKLPVAASSIESLLGQHQASLFTPEPGQPAVARRASLNIWYLTLKSIVDRFLYGQPME